MNIYRKFIHWAKYGELGYHPELRAVLEPDEAMKRLQEYQREEERTCKPWLRSVSSWILPLTAVDWLLIMFAGISNTYVFKTFLIVQVILIFILLGLRHRRYTRFINAKIAEDLNGGRWWNCVKCGWNLREEKDSCPECGASVYVSPTTKEM